MIDEAGAPPPFVPARGYARSDQPEVHRGSADRQQLKELIQIPPRRK
jgi:hypothetical protein